MRTYRKVCLTVENEKLIKNDRAQTIRAGEDTKLTISRREFSLGLSGMMLGGAILEVSDHHEANTLVAKTTVPQQLKPQTLDQAQYVLSSTTGSLWSPDSRHIAAFQENIVTLYNASTGTPDLSYNKHTDEILTVKWSADSNYLASSGFDRIVHVWNAVLGQTVTLYKGHDDIVRDVAWSPNQRYIASAGYDKVVHVWEALTGKMVVTCSGHDAEIQTLSWSPDSKYIASTDLQNRTMIWRIM